MTNTPITTRPVVSLDSIQRFVARIFVSAKSSVVSAHVTSGEGISIGTASGETAILAEPGTYILLRVNVDIASGDLTAGDIEMLLNTAYTATNTAGTEIESADHSTVDASAQAEPEQAGQKEKHVELAKEGG